MNENTRDAVRKSYGAVARAGLGSTDDGIKSIARAFGYSDDELSSIPAEANMGLSCGNPVAMASIREGETVVDLGSGGGLDVFLASQRIGPTGRAIGVDMTGDMITLARRNARRGGYENVRFYLAEIEAMPLPDNSVDCVISNCVLNLCPDKDAAFREIHRILKPGGRLAISDIALKQALPPEIEREVAAWTGCVAGAMTITETREKLGRAGFGNVDVQDAGSDLNAYRDGGSAACCGPELATDAGDTGDAADAADAGCCAPAADASAAEASSCCGEQPAAQTISTISTINSAAPDFHAKMGQLLDTFDVNAYAASVKIFAVKPV